MSESIGEFELIDWIRRHVSNAGGRVALGIGDDCAALRFTPGREVVVTTDMLMEGRHFVVGDDASLRRIGEKALGVNLSDIAAMAAEPVAAVAAVALPRGRAAANIARHIHAGMAELAERFDVALVGGDTNAWDGPLVISITVLGEATEHGLVTRSNARPGDTIFVTGPLGGSLWQAKQRHLTPVPRIREALALHALCDMHAMIDISDGLAADLGHILEESGRLGAILEAEAIPIHDDARAMARDDGRSPLDHALHDGEDFELCFTVDGITAERLRENLPRSLCVYPIGTITAAPSLGLRHADGRTQAMAPRGFNHLID